MSGIDDFKAAVEAGDWDAAHATLADDVTFNSPVVFKPYEGREAVSALLGFVAQVFEDFRYFDVVRDGDRAVLRFKARVGDREVEGLDILGENADGLIDDFTVMTRPLSGTNALAQAMAAKLAG